MQSINISRKYGIQEIQSIDFPMSREKYLSAWKIFRSISDENYITARHIVSLDEFSQCNSILDIGCGDGLITKGIVLNSLQQIDRVILIDPDEGMLKEAEMHLREIDVVKGIQTELNRFENCLYKYVDRTYLFLAVHLVYLISEESFKLLIETLPLGSKLVIILDDEDSIFTKLWTHTASKYASRSKFVRTYLSEKYNEFNIQKTTIVSKIVNPLKLRMEIKSAILSLMCYSDFLQMPNDLQLYVEKTIEENLIGRFIECKSVCYVVNKNK